MKVGKEYLEELYVKKKFTLNLLAFKFGVSPPTIRNWLIKYNIPRRKNTGWRGGNI